MRAVVDSGPLIAFFDVGDDYHQEAIAFFKEFRGQLAITLAVTTEVVHMLNFNLRIQRHFLRWVSGLDLLEIRSQEMSELASLMEKYQDRPMDFADATLVFAAEREGIKHVVSIDSDFDIYRISGKQKFINLF